MRSRMAPPPFRGIVVSVAAVVAFIFPILLASVTARAAQLDPPVLTATATSSSQIALDWTDPNPNEGGFTVERALSPGGPFTQIAETDKNTSSYTASGLSAGTTYYFRVQAFANGNGGVSPWSNVASARTLGGSGDTTAPTVSITSPASGTTYTSAQTVTINVSASDNVGVARVEFYLDGSRVSTDTASPYSYAWSITSASNGSHSWKVTAYDAAGNSRDAGPITLNVNIGGGGGADLTPPSIPTGLTATATGCGQVSLTWSASTDTGGSGLLGYAIYRDIFFVGETLAPTTSFVETGLAASTTYSYTVTAIDNVGNVSAHSVASGATTQSCNPSQAEGAHLWSRRIGGSGSFDSAFATAAGVDIAGNILLAGNFQRTVDFGGQSLTSVGLNDVFVAKYSPTGTRLWSKRYGGTSDDFATGVAVDTGGNVYVTGYFTGTADFGGGPVTSTGMTDIFLVKYTSAGAFVWMRTAGSTSNDRGYDVAVDGSGNAIVTGYFIGTVNFGGTSLTSVGGADIFLAKYSSTGAHVWSRSYGGTSGDVPQGVAVDGTGAVYVTGYFLGSANFGTTSSLTSAGGYDVFLARYSSAGAYQWAKRFGGSGSDIGSAVATDANGNAVFTGSFSGSVSFGGSSLPDTGGAGDIFVAKLSSTGAHLWSKGFGTSNSYGDSASDVALDSFGNVALTGSIFGSTDFGGGPLYGNGSDDIFVTKLSSSGEHLWSGRYGAGYGDHGRCVAVDSVGNVVAGGDFSASVDFGGGLLNSPGGVDSFLVKFTP